MSINGLLTGAAILEDRTQGNPPRFVLIQKVKRGKVCTTPADFKLDVQDSSNAENSMCWTIIMHTYFGNGRAMRLDCHSGESPWMHVQAKQMSQTLSDECVSVCYKQAASMDCTLHTASHNIIWPWDVEAALKFRCCIFKHPQFTSGCPLTFQNPSLKTSSVSGETRFCSALTLKAGFSFTAAAAATDDLSLCSTSSVMV